MLTRYLTEYQTQLNSAANPIRAAGMAAYMKHQFAFIGIPTPERRKLVKPVEMAAAKQCTETELLELALALWQQAEREFQYCAVDLLVRSQKKLSATALPVLQRLITSKSWWDSIDLLASKVVGEMARRDTRVVEQLDLWLTSNNLWQRRTAIIYQLNWTADTDEVRLLHACLTHSHDPDFFIRKAIGWALRQYARVQPERVRSFVQQHRNQLSPLSVREALKHL